MAHTGNDGLGLFIGLLVAAGHDSQGPGDGHGVAAADGRIQQVHASRLGLGVQLLNNVRSRRTEVHDDVAGLTVLNGLLHGIADNGVGRQNLENNITVLIDLHRVADRRAACRREVVQLLLGNVIAQNLTAALFYNILCHGQSHNAHP